MAQLLGLHHVTATVDRAQPDVTFFVGLLGLRLVKRTVNFDNTGVYHFYYGDEVGTPSTLMTTFPYGGEGVGQGRHGAGQITVTTFSVPEGSMEGWRRRLKTAGVEVAEAGERFGHPFLEVRDPSGLRIELREASEDERVPWRGGGVPPERAIRGIHSVTLLLRDPQPTLDFLRQVLGLEVVGEEGSSTQVAVGPGGAGALLELQVDPEAPQGVNGLGTVHHVALAVATGENQATIQSRVRAQGVEVTPVRDRQYFRSIYFRGPGGILYEVATQGPGFTIDESRDELGLSLKLPPWEEANRDRIESRLPEISLEDLI